MKRDGQAVAVVRLCRVLLNKFVHQVARLLNQLLSLAGPLCGQKQFPLLVETAGEVEAKLRQTWEAFGQTPKAIDRLPRECFRLWELTRFPQEGAQVAQDDGQLILALGVPGRFLDQPSLDCQRRVEGLPPLRPLF